MLDGAKRAVVVLSPAGEYLAPHSYEFVPGRITSAGPGRIVVTSTNTWSRDIDQPLHLMNLSSGATTLEFGASNAGAEKTDADRRFAGMLRGSVSSRAGTVWWGSIRTPAVEEWSLEGCTGMHSCLMPPKAVGEQWVECRQQLLSMVYPKQCPMQDGLLTRLRRRPMKSPRLLIPIPFLLLTAPVLTAQEVLNWGDFELCEDCELEVTELVRLGDADGPGIIEGADVRVVWDEEIGYLHFLRFGTRIKIFDHDGTFLREIGGEGDGPGEFRGIGYVQVIDGRVVVLDVMKSAIVILSPAGEYITQHSYRLPETGPISPVGQDRIVVTTTTWRTRVIEHPLHLLDLSSGAITLRFGAANAGAEVTDLQWNFGKRVAASVMSRPGTVWWGWVATPAVQEWSAEGEFLRDFDGDLPWFPEIYETPDWAREPPETLLRQLALDGDDNLWMLIRTADPEWDEVPMVQGRGGLYPAPNTEDDYHDLRLDVFSLGERRHLGRHVWDGWSTSLLDRGGEPAVFVLEYGRAMVPQIVVYGVRAGGR